MTTAFVPGNGIRAAIVDAPGAEPRLGSVVLPVRTSGTTLLAVIAAPLNPLDLSIASGTFHSARHESPYTPGSECVGAVLESDRYLPGCLVYAECHASPATPGVFATHALISDEDLLPLPDGLDPVLAAAVGNSGTAAFIPLIEQARLLPGEKVLVLGATGAVGQLAVQVAHRSGGARVVNVGNPAGATAQVPAGLLRGKQLTLSGFAGLHTPLREKRAALTWLWNAVARGEIKIEVRTFPLGDVAAAWRAQSSSPHAKCVILPDPSPDLSVSESLSTTPATN